MHLLAHATINSGSCEDSTHVGAAGVVPCRAIDMSPFHRINYALYFRATGAREASFSNLKTLAEYSAEKLVNTAARDSSNLYAIKKKNEIVDVTKSNQ
eukprot:CAMPEP_0194394950 /NCGR_PEP_ID=MMETSP0174-20130528/124143_1 /TAXON_ID=216777 /ORGANISM="Proboscia alata, Strain PI-D3" /LENGTH=97 /DNA_ID=CAMNT_0039190813 /DNA_START=422 /DNA_END=714 /DNA_ORIENTATION=+